MNPRIVRRWESFEAKREKERERRRKKKKNTLRNCGATNCCIKKTRGRGKTRGMIKAAISPLINFNRSAHGRPWWLIKFSGKTTFTSVPEPRYCAADSWKIYVANAAESASRILVTYSGIPEIFFAFIARLSPPSNSNCFIVIIAIPFNVKRVWENIYLGTRNDVKNVFYRVWSDFQLCIGNLWFLFAADYLIPIPWRTVLYQKWFFLSKKDSFILQQILKSKYCEIEISKIHFMK